MGQLSCYSYEFLSSVFFTDENTGYAAGRFGTILKTVDGGGIVKVKEKEALKPTFKLYPNPSNIKVFITSETNLHEKPLIKIFTLEGKEIIIKQVWENNKVELDISELASGIYIIKIQTNEIIEVNKLIIN